MPNTNRVSPNCTCCGRKLNSMLRSEVEFLCTVCYEEAGIENEHTDGHHDAAERGPQANCKGCNPDFDPHAGIRTRQASGQQGKVVNAATDSRIKGQAAAPAADAAVISFPARPTLRGKPAPAFAGKTYQVIKTNHTWAGHKWTQVRVEGMETNKWFWNEDLTVPARRSRRTSAA